MILGLIRNMLGRCPICGGRLINIYHDCVHGDKYKCTRCKNILRDRI